MNDSTLQSQLKRQVDEIVETLEMGPDDWFEFWHTHLDWDGAGNASPEARRPYLKALFDLLQRLQQRLPSFPKPCQIWLFIDESDSGQDAVYLHSPNPNRDNFPLDFGFVDFSAECPAWIIEFVPADRYRVGRDVREGEVVYFIVPK